MWPSLAVVCVGVNNGAIKEKGEKMCRVTARTRHVPDLDLVRLAVAHDPTTRRTVAVVDAVLQVGHVL